MTAVELSSTAVGPPVNATAGATLSTTSEKVVLVVVCVSSAVIVTVRLSSGPSVVWKLQLQVPAAFVPACVIVPMEADRLTVSPAFASDHVPVLAAESPSSTVTVAFPAATDGATFAGVHDAASAP